MLELSTLARMLASGPRVYLQPIPKLVLPPENIQNLGPKFVNIFIDVRIPTTGISFKRPAVKEIVADFNRTVANNNKIN